VISAMLGNVGREPRQLLLAFWLKQILSVALFYKYAPVLDGMLAISEMEGKAGFVCVAHVVEDLAPQLCTLMLELEPGSDTALHVGALIKLLCVARRASKMTKFADAALDSLEECAFRLTKQGLAV